MSDSSAINFGIWDYTILSSVLILSLIIGIYHVIFSGKTTRDYTLGNQQMSILPVTLSLIATHFSGVSLLGIPAEIYNYGATYIISIIEALLATWITSFVYLPVFYNLKICSIYQYLEKRYNKTIQRIASFAFVFQTLIINGFLIYIPSFTLSQVTGFEIWTSVVIIGLVGIIYTSLGGIKAVMWTDTFQSIFMVAPLVLIIALGFNKLGVSFVWEKNLEAGKLDIFNFDPDPTVRYTIWSMLLGNGFITLTRFSTTQAYVQRYLSMPSLHLAKITLWLNFIGYSVFIILICCAGLILYAAYWDCDPIQSMKIKSADQLLLHFLLDNFAITYPGLSGLMVAGIFCGTISTLSSTLNSAATVLYTHTVQVCSTAEWKKKRGVIFIKILTILIGILCIGLIPLIQNMRGILASTFSLVSVVSGPIHAVFTLGLLFPAVSSKSVIAGSVVGFAIPCWFIIGAQIQDFKQQTWIGSTDNCNATFDVLTLRNTSLHQSTQTIDDVLWIYRVSFLWHRLFAFLLTFCVSLICTFLIGWKIQSENYQVSLLAPCAVRFTKVKPKPTTDEQLMRKDDIVSVC